ncbi:MAG: ATP-binding protein [Bacteroidia bacterium]
MKTKGKVKAVTKQTSAKKKNQNKMPNQQLELDSASESIHIVEKLIDAICANYRVTEDHYGNILVAVTEAVNNAIYHGNKAHPQKKIHVTFSSSHKAISFTVRDEGDGFDFKNLPDPTDPKNIEKPTGRGVFLMHRLADNVKFSEKGRCVSLSFDIIAN